MKAKDSRTLEQYYKDCNFESDTSSFTDFMQSQMDKNNQIMIPQA